MCGEKPTEWPIHLEDWPYLQCSDDELSEEHAFPSYEEYTIITPPEFIAKMAELCPVKE